MTRLLTAALGLFILFAFAGAQDTPPKVAVGAKAPVFKFTDQTGKTIDLAPPWRRAR